MFRLWRFHSAHFGEVHLSHQAVHSTFADRYAIITCKADLDFTAPESFVSFCVDLKDFSLDIYILLLPAGWLLPKEFVICAPVYVQSPAQDGNGMLAR